MSCLPPSLPPALFRPHPHCSCHRCGTAEKTEVARAALLYCSGTAASERYSRRRCTIHGERVDRQCPGCNTRRCTLAFHPDCIKKNFPGFDLGTTQVRREETKEAGEQHSRALYRTVSNASTGAGWICPRCVKICNCSKCPKAAPAATTATALSSSASEASSACSGPDGALQLLDDELLWLSPAEMERFHALEAAYPQLAAQVVSLRAENNGLRADNRRLCDERNAARAEVERLSRVIAITQKQPRYAEQRPLPHLRPPGIDRDWDRDGELYCAGEAGEQPEEAAAVAVEVRPCHRCGAGKDEGEQTPASASALRSPLVSCASCSLAYCRDCLGPDRQPRPADSAASFTWLRLASSDARWTCPRCQRCCACDACTTTGQHGEEGETVDTAAAALSGLSLHEEPAETSAAVSNEGQTTPS